MRARPAIVSVFAVPSTRSCIDRRAATPARRCLPAIPTSSTARSFSACRPRTSNVGRRRPYSLSDDGSSVLLRGEPTGAARPGGGSVTADRYVKISGEQVEWLRIAAKRMAFDDSLLASTAIMLEVVEAYERAPRTRLGALLGRTA